MGQYQWFTVFVDLLVGSEKLQGIKKNQPTELVQFEASSISAGCSKKL